MTRLLRSSCVMLGLVVVLPAVGHTAAPSSDRIGPPRPLADLVGDLSGPGRIRKLKAAEAIRDHYKGRSLEALPQIIKALGVELDRPTQPNMVRDHVLDQALRQAADGAGPDRIKVIQESTRHSDPRVRAGAFRAWLSAGLDRDTSADWDGLLAAVRRGFRDDAPLVREQVIETAHAFWGAPSKVVDEVVPLFAAALDDQARVRDWMPSLACRAAGVLHGFKAQAKPAIPALAKAAAADDVRLAGLSCSALRAVAQADPTAAQEIVNILRPLLTDKKRSDDLRGCAAHGLNTIGPAGRWAIEDLADVLEEPGVSADLRITILNVLRNSGPRAAPAVPSLIRRLERATDEREQIMLLSALQAIGPAAFSAVEVIEKWMDNAERGEMREKAHAALRAIKG